MKKSTSVFVFFMLLSPYGLMFYIYFFHKGVI